jgi:hypothetical protein
MFEHLVSQHHVSGRPKKNKVNFYSSLLLLAGFVLLSVLNIGQGSQSSALEQGDVIKDVTVNVYTQTAKGINKLADQTQQVVVFDFYIESNKNDVALETIQIQTHGFDDPSSLALLDLYNNKTQLGEPSEIIDGQLRFRLDDYKLQKGKNYFYLSWPKINRGALAGDISFSIDGETDVVVSYDNAFFRPGGDFPVISKTLQIVDNGRLSSYNNLSRHSFLAVAEQQEKLADFALSTVGESIKLEEIVVAVETSVASESQFSLVYDNKVIAKSYLSDQELHFNLREPVVVKNDQDVSLRLYGNLPKGEYGFSLIDGRGKGFVSGDYISFSNSLSLSEVIALPGLPTFSAQSSTHKLDANWNTLSAIDIQNSGEKIINIHKLSWAIEDFGVDIENLELWINDQLYKADLEIVDGVLAVTFWDKPLLLDDADLNIVLLGKVNILADQYRLQASLLTDKTIMSHSNSHNNILWSVDSEMHNSYLLPDLPLAPVILE